MKDKLKLKLRNFFDSYLSNSVSVNQFADSLKQDLKAEINRKSQDMAEFYDEKFKFIAKQLETIQSASEQSRDLMVVEHDNIPSLKKELKKLREQKDYSKYFTKPEPLVSIRMATYNRSKLLCERAIPSILRQTYQNFEIVIVGDHCTDDTEEQIKKMNDKRIRFYNLPRHSYYPDDKFKRWLIVGAEPANTAVSLAKGDWIATLDDDDEYRPNHLETLVKLAQATQSELAYSALLSTHVNTKEQKVIWSDPPRLASFSMMSAIYLRALFEFIPTDEQGWAVREPQDWYLCRRMLEAGVKYAATETVTGDIHLLNYSEKEEKI